MLSFGSHYDSQVVHVAKSLFTKILNFVSLKKFYNDTYDNE